jgi:hypothetical protein
VPPNAGDAAARQSRKRIEIEHAALESNREAACALAQPPALASHERGGDAALVAEGDEVILDVYHAVLGERGAHVAVDVAQARVRVLSVGGGLQEPHDALLEALAIVGHEEQRLGRIELTARRLARRGDLVPGLRREQREPLAQLPVIEQCRLAKEELLDPQPQQELRFHQGEPDASGALMS